MTASFSSLEAVLQAIRAHEDELRRCGIRHAAVFGAAARGESSPDAVIDILVTLDSRAMPDLFTFAGIGVDLEAWLGRPVEVIHRDRLAPRRREQALREAVAAF